jgi:hypothetical protein
MDAIEEDEVTAAGVSAAVASGVNVNAQRWGQTPLHLTVQPSTYSGGSNKLQAAAALLAAGADPNFKNANGETAVWWATCYGTAESLQLVIDCGGSVNEADNSGRTPIAALLTAFRSDVSVTATLSVLLSCPALDLDATYNGKPVEQSARNPHHAAAIIAEVCLIGTDSGVQCVQLTL